MDLTADYIIFKVDKIHLSENAYRIYCKKAPHRKLTNGKYFLCGLYITNN